MLVTLELRDQDGSCTSDRVESIASVLVRVTYQNVQDGPCQPVSTRSSDVASLDRELATLGLRFEDIPPGLLTVEVHGYQGLACPTNAIVLCGRIQQNLNGALEEIEIPIRCADDFLAPELAPCRP